MEEVRIPNGRELRYRCGVRGCRAPGKTYSMVTIYDHLAKHYEDSTMSDGHFNFRCRRCGLHFYLYGLTLSCVCTERNGTRNDCVVLGTGYSRPVAHRHIDFYRYLKLNAVPVFDTKVASQTEGSHILSAPERSEEVESAIMRSPSEYNDGTPRTPLVENDEENDEPAYAPVFRSRSREGSVASVRMGSGSSQEERSGIRGDRTPRSASTVRAPIWSSGQAGLPQENPPRSPTTPKTRRSQPPLLISHSQPCSSGSSYGSTSLTPVFYASGNSQHLVNSSRPQLPPSPFSTSQMRRGNEFGSTTTVHPPCPPTPGLAPVPCPPPLPTYAGILPVTFPYGPYQAYSSSSFMGGPAGQFFDPTQLWPPSVVHPAFAPIPNPWAPHVDPSGLNTTSTAQLSATTSTLARNPPERMGGTKFLGIPPLHKTPKKPGVLTPRRKRQS